MAKTNMISSPLTKGTEWFVTIEPKTDDVFSPLNDPVFGGQLTANTLAQLKSANQFTKLDGQSAATRDILRAAGFQDYMAAFDLGENLPTGVLRDFIGVDLSGYQRAEHNDRRRLAKSRLDDAVVSHLTQFGSAVELEDFYRKKAEYDQQRARDVVEGIGQASLLMEVVA